MKKIFFNYLFYGMKIMKINISICIWILFVQDLIFFTPKNVTIRKILNGDKKGEVTQVVHKLFTT